MKKAQEEIVGMAVIVVIVVIIMVVLLGFILKNPPAKENKKEVENFLDSVALYTTECEENAGFLDLSELSVACYENKMCNNGELSCEILNKSINKITDSVFILSEENIKGYIFEVFYKQEGSSLLLASKKAGSCLGDFSSSENAFAFGGGIVVLRMKECL